MDLKLTGMISTYFNSSWKNVYWRTWRTRGNFNWFAGQFIEGSYFKFIDCHVGKSTSNMGNWTWDIHDFIFTDQKKPSHVLGMGGRELVDGKWRAIANIRFAISLLSHISFTCWMSLNKTSMVKVVKVFPPSRCNKKQTHIYNASMEWTVNSMIYLITSQSSYQRVGPWGPPR